MSKHFKYILLLCALSLVWGCTTDKLMKKEDLAIENETSKVTPTEPRQAPAEIKPLVEEKKAGPLEGKTISLTADSARFTEIFSAIAEIAGLDLVIDSRLMTQEAAAKQLAIITRIQPRKESPAEAAPQAKNDSIIVNIDSRSRDRRKNAVQETEQGAYLANPPQSQGAQGQNANPGNTAPIALRPVNVSFNKTPLNQALEHLSESLNVYYEIRGKCLYIKGTKSKTYHLNFVSSHKETKISVGGDVIGGVNSGDSGGSSSSSPLMGQFSIQSTNPTSSNDIYTQVEQIVSSSLTEHGSFSLNRSIGFLEVNDRKSALDRIDVYIKTLKAFYDSQVLITAKILEVSLNDSSIYGIDWSSLNGSIKNYTFNPIQQSLTFGTDTLVPALTLQAQNTKSGFDATLEALQQFGDIKVLSNPRIRVTNGQPAMISVGTNQSYVQKVERTVTISEGQTETDTEVTISSVFDGVMFGVQPYIDLETNEVNLSITPIKSRIVDMEERTIDSNTFTLPTIDLKEATTQLRVRSGNIVVLGGLISKNLSHTNKSIPVLGTIPWVGYLFSQRETSVQTSELVILLEPVILAQ